MAGGTDWISQRIQVNGLFLGVAQHGELQAPRETLLLLHGFTGSSASWSTVLSLLETPGRRLIALDLHGHGRADAPTDAARYTIEHCQADILAVLNTLGIQPGETILLGYSMGGRIALYTAFSAPWQALILESASPGLADAREREQRRQNDMALAERIEREGVEKFSAYWAGLPLFASQKNLPEKVREMQRAQRLNNRARGLANSLRGVGTGVQPALHGRLSELKLPVLLLAGELDEKFCGIARQMAQSMPQASLCIVPGAGHTIHLEQPELFARQVNEFCNTLC